MMGDAGSGTRSPMPRLGVDLIDTRRIGRVAADFGASAEHFVLGQGDGDEAGAQMWPVTASLTVRLAGTLAVKEAWLKAGGRRQPGWRFTDAWLAAAPASRWPAVGSLAMTAFTRHLHCDLLAAGTVREQRPRRAAEARAEGQPSADAWAWCGRRDHWLISGVIL
jgi:phosphopantetheinyl transferase (holo-ACP synthase)